MVDSFWVSFLCFFLISGSESLDGRDFINLSQFDYSVIEIFHEIHIKFANIPDVKMQIKCPNCITSDSLTISCIRMELIKVDIEMEMKRFRISFPFNISSNSHRGRNTHIIYNIFSLSGTNAILVSWASLSIDINHYYLIITDSYRVYTKEILRETLYRVENLKEKTWYQICIASIDIMWRTGKFNCKKVLTDFSTTGPVRNVTTIPESNRVLISWSSPEYEYDIPQGFIIYLQGKTNQICRLYIIKPQHDIDPTSQYSCVTTETITSSLSSLEIKDLPPNSEFNIEISPFNRNKKSVKKYLTIKTKEGESGPVQNLKVDPDRNLHTIHISFDAPINPAGIILKYRLRVILKRINICTSNDDVIHEAYTDNLYGYILKSVMTKCGSYMLDAAPVNGWNSNGGVGKTVSVPFTYSMDQQSSWTVNTKFISSNSLTVSLGGLKEDKCENFGLIIEIKDEKDHFHCMTRIISNLDCEDFKMEINTTQKCQIKQFITKYNHSSTYESFFSGIFRSEHSYEVNIYKIANDITQVTEKRTYISNVGDCFTDCYIYRRFYPGIRSVTEGGRVCTNWKNSNYKYANVKSNICIYDVGIRPWCPDTNSHGWDFCDVPECSSIFSGTGCVDLINKQEDVQSVTIKWSRPQSLIRIIGYLVLLHNSDHFCEQAFIQLCDTCGNIDALGSQIKNLYLSCESKEDKSSITFQASFTHLHQNRNYNVYIAPIMSSSSVGEIRNVTVRTTLARPYTPNGVNYQLDTPRTIKFNWQPNIETQTNGPAEYYVTYITNRKNGKTISTRINTESVTFGDLEMCTEYCFVLNSVNVAGHSGYTREVCEFTLAPKPEKSVLVDPPSGYMRNLSLRWTYLGSDNCQKRYLVEYYVKFIYDGTLSSNTNHTSVVLTDLKLNVIYTVSVRAEGQMKTVNNENIGEFSPYKEFYTGTFSPTLSYYQHNLDYTNQILNVSWEIQQEMQGSIFMYIIRVKNITDHCMYSVLLTCQTCREPWTWNNIKDKHGESLKYLANCTLSLNGIMDADQTSFNYLIRLTRNITAFSVDVYGVNLIGIHLLNWKRTSTASPVLFLVTVVIIIVVLLFFTIFIYVKLKGNPLRLINKETELKNQSYLMSKTKEQEQERFWADRQLTSNAGPFNSKVAISAFPAYYGEVRRNGSADLIKQFKKLTKEAKAQEDALELTVYVGKNLVNSRKNHSLNILPYDQTRVKVGKTGVPLNYINASYIPFENIETQIEYIAAQGPIQETLSDFWEMIWEQNIHYIINLTRALENEKPKSLQYWPNSTQQNVTYGSENTLLVTLVREKKKKSHVERELFVLNTQCQMSRKIIQLHMHTWSDHSVPEWNFFDRTLFRFHKITNDDTLHPYLVHCSAGVGATGTFICIDRIIKQLIGNSQEIGIYDTVLKLRKYRNFMVEHQAQYIFIHEFLNHFLMKYMKIEDLEDDNIYDT